MSDIQVLVATMHQKDFSLAEKMNIGCSAVFANQTDHNSVNTIRVNESIWKMISTDTKGVGLNRNIALLAADGDIVLFADDDITYYDDTLEGVKIAFHEYPEADVIIFSVDLEKNGSIYEHRSVPHKRMRIWNSLKYGTYVIAARRKSLLKKNIKFHQLFGGGCLYGSGEDTLFLKECFEKKLKVYSYDYVLGKCNKDHSSWFEGYNEKFFYDKGALLCLVFPKIKYFMLLYFSVKFRKTRIPFVKRVWLMICGAKNVQQLIPYSKANIKLK